MKAWHIVILVIAGALALWCAACGMGLGLSSENDRLPNKISTTPSP